MTTGAAAGLIAAGLLGGQWRPQELPSQVEWLWWTGMFFWLMGILMLAARSAHAARGARGRPWSAVAPTFTASPARCSPNRGRAEPTGTDRPGST
ncbi:hypothetical protein ACFQX6_58225 [Streptosporangium lutulentum]